MKHRLRHIVTALVGIAIVGVALVGCTDPVDWSDYIGVNLIAARDFDAVDSDGNALWYFSDELTTATEGAADFVTWEAVDASVYGSLPSGVDGPVYRLEVVNLLPNGDFEDADFTASGWDDHDDDTGDDTIVVAQETASPLSGAGSLSLDFGSSADRYYIDLDTALADAFVADVVYAFHVDFQMPVNTVGFEINDGTEAGVQLQWQVTRGEGERSDRIYRYPGTGLTDFFPASFSQTNTFTVSSGDSWSLFSFGGINTTAQERADGVFDDLRVVRADQGHYVRLPVPYLDDMDTSRPELISGGTYTVSFWVLPDPEAGSNNRIAARLVSAGLDTSVANSAITPGKSVTVATDGPRDVTALTDWSELTFEISGAGVQLSTDTAADDVLFDVVIEIGRFAGGSEYTDAGSILLAEPALEWSPN